MLPFTAKWLTEARLASAYQRRLEAPGVLAAARAAALGLLERALGQDTLAAEYVPWQRQHSGWLVMSLHLCARVHKYACT